MSGVGPRLDWRAAGPPSAVALLWQRWREAQGLSTLETTRRELCLRKLAGTMYCQVLSYAELTLFSFYLRANP